MYGLDARDLNAALLLFADALVRCWERLEERRRLMALDDRALSDLGIGRGDAWREASKPCWRD